MVDTSMLFLILALVVTLYAVVLVRIVRYGMTRYKCIRSGVRFEKPASNSPWRYVHWILFALAIAGLVLLAYARLIEPYRLSVEEIHISSPKIPPGTPPIRIVFFSDMHSDPEPRLEPRIPEVVRNLSPDIIIFGGDALNTTEGAAHFRKLMTELVKIAPTFAVLGNWEIWRTPKADLYEGTGVDILDAESAKIRVGNIDVWLAGFSVKYSYPKSALRKRSFGLVRQTLGEIPKDRFKIFIHHFPEIAAHAAGTGADLALAGDTHGGQVRLPLLGPLTKVSRLEKFYDQGLYEIGPGLLYINRGIGMEGDHYPRLRFNCVPEITLVVVESEGN